ncbi:hypothetical protein [Chitinophaga caseinilytica]|uniref:Uncharacterized protein n=1 Tax=Chitinophaga caseinilytica TaxID=2267521 RepID=A0ABZ2Z249_9BACT
MTLLELDLKLRDLKINPKNYSLNGDLKSDAIILFHNFENWNVFYLDDRGGRSEEKIFATEGEACLHIYKHFLIEKDIADKFNLNT